MIANDAVLPPLRQELRLEPASATPEGAPRWRLYDPLQHRFFLIGEDDVGLLSHWACGTVGALRKALGRLQQSLDEDQLDGLMRFLGDHHLLQTSGKQANARLADQAAALKGHGLRGLINKLMAFRQPVWNPRRLIARSLPWIDAIGQRSMLVVWALLTLLGLYLTSRQWDDFLNTFSDFLSVKGAICYALALAGLKVWHELGHAYMATRHGCRVGNMGVSIFMGVPMLYTELGDIARVDNPRQRMWIAAGGVLAESLVAGLATLAWAILPEGSLRSVAFVIATSSWVTSLVVNLNPLSRFDGYHFCSDMLRIDNLQPRALAYGQWAIGRVLFGAVENPPEPVSRRRAAFFIGYGALVWLYQVSLSLSIAWFTYKSIFKTLGVLILLYTLQHFVGRRLMRVGKHWWRLRERVATRRRALLLALGTGLIALCLLPLDRHVDVPVMLGWQYETPIQAPENARIEQILVSPGAQVEQGQVLMRFFSPELDSKRDSAQANLTIATERLNRIGGDAEDRAQAIVLVQQQLQAQADLKGLAERAGMLQWRAPKAGVVVDMPANLQVGQWVRPDTTLGRVLEGSAQDASGFAAEKDLPRLQVGARGEFLPDEPSLARRAVTLTGVDPNASEFISPDSLSSRYGGPIGTQPDDKGKAVPVQAQHRIHFTVDGAADGRLPQRIRGQVRVEALPQSLASQVLIHLWQLLMAELRD
ncbi:efflux RND transporter periplasmic adaptor subunit [Pseudomonas sp. HR96]|uniref:HlyD family efflux transporter periplasmic adaptor subunit n=1 Tax=Pseudomonas sp. HR96 TaxID=1027966 RepID=UPI002A74CB28|nr:HlyD family efflux transporter periplasmic adaptor subunit [Pseudomonas sp. HR96]WPO97716.1 efflux RND transporter periplasmic adaptor subunit [Pseudomonas sp. HR96]